MKYHIILNIVPQTWKRHDKHGHNKPEYTTYKTLLQELLWVHNHESKNPWPARYEGNVELSLKFCGKNLRGDVDNYAKAVMDSLQGVLIVNDRQVQILNVAIIYGENYVEITMEDL